MSVRLTDGCIAAILQGQQVENPVVQLINHKKITSSNASDRYRVIISDGKWFNSYAMLATQLNEKITNNELPEFTIIRLDNYVPSDLPANKNGPGGPSKKKIIVILALTVLQNGNSVGMKIGDPKMYDESNDGRSNETPNSRMVNGSSSTSFGSSSTPSGSSSTSYGMSSSMSAAPVNNAPVNNSSINSPVVGPILSIAGLNPYQGRWNIKARVTSKSAIRTWTNARGDGKLFSMDLQDQSGGIRATAFNDSVDKFHDMIELNKIYYFSRLTVKPANKKFTTLTHEFELTFNNDTQVLPAPDEDTSIPQIQYNFTPLCALKDLQPESVVDIIGVCKSAGEVQNLIARTTKRELKKRDLLLVDQTDASVTFTLWGAQAEEFDASTMPVIAVKSARVTEFNGGKSVGMGGNATMQINPDIEKSHRLRGWFDSLGDNHQFSNISRASGETTTGKIYLLKEVNTHNLGMQDKADYFSCDGAVMFVPHDRAIYQSCPNPDCKKKVIDQNDNSYRCEKCNQTYSNYVYRLILNIQVCDWTGSQWISMFQEQAEALLGATAQEIGESREKYDDSFDSYFKKPLFKYHNFRVRAKVDTYNNESRLRLTAVGLKPIDLKETNNRLLNEIKMLSGVSLPRTQM